MKRAIYPGTFDPVTYGHLDVIRRAAKLADELVVGILINTSKNPLFSVEERVEMLKEVTKDIPNVTVESFEGLLVEFARAKDASVIRGLRCGSDFDYELQLAQANREIAPDVDTVFIGASKEVGYISSTIVREAATFGADITKFVPQEIAKLVIDRINKNKLEKLK